MRFATFPALVLGSALLVGCTQDAPTRPDPATLEAAVFNGGNAPGGGGGGGTDATLEWYVEFNDVDLGKSLDIKIYHYDYHTNAEASGSGTFQDLDENRKARLDVDQWTAGSPPYVTVEGSTNKYGPFTLTLIDTEDCATVEGHQQEATLTVPDASYTSTFCGNITYQNSTN